MYLKVLDEYNNFPNAVSCARICCWRARPFRLALDVFGEEKVSLDLTQLLHLIEKMPTYRQLVDELKRPNGNTRVVVLDAAKPYLIAALYQSLRLPTLIVTAQPENSKKLYEQLLTWSNSQVKLFPEPDGLPYQRIASDASTELERIQALSALAKINGDQNAPLIVTSAPAFMQKTALYRDFSSSYHTIKLGMDIEPFKLLSQWEAMGYRIENIVEVPGTISHRGGIIDIYPPTSDLPARLEFFGNTIDSIRLFDPASQRSLTTVSSIAVGPATELLTPLLSNRPELESVLNSIDLSGCSSEVRQQFKQEIAMLLNKQRPSNIQFYAPLFNKDSILNYLSQDALLVLDEPLNIKLAMEDLDAQANELRTEKLAWGELPHNFPRPYFTWGELEARMENRRCLTLTAWGLADEQQYKLSFAPAPSYAGQLPLFIKKAKQMLQQKQRLILISHQASRLSELLGEEALIASPLTEIKQIPQPGSLTLVQGSLAEGWVMNNTTYLFTDAEIFGFVKQRRLGKRRPVPHHKLFIDIAPGDYVVHIEHGIAKFSGVTTIGTDDSRKEYLVLQYAADDKLYVPTDQIDRVNRYIGAGEQPPVLSRLGTQEWTRTKQKVKESVESVAHELLALYAAREVIPGFAFSPDTVWQQELEASFPYVETPDQVEALNQVKEDMTKAKPMDRLVCGDVGYGKTEVAIRAAFKAVMDNKQVAVLVPTTVLAQQHLTTFSQRLDAFPIRIEVLSRFRTPKEQQAILDGLANGSVDICIGTHRLLQKDVVFKDLGLLIIDEEQRFGVAHKEYLKKMRQEVDVLTLSATPIPRTLHMSLVGVRDMSTMETPPEERLPIKTYVAEYDERLIREAILRELERNGQVFFVHNQVQSIGYIANKLQSLVPEAKIAIAHGQMPEVELETVMADFTRGKSDVLVCTTIIESGLDMPNVNTLIVNKADKFGLTQLYQLRGRVGRGANLAHAYFLFDKGKYLTPTAEKRLRTIFEATELGAGFGIAMKDLEIRGAGTLLGVKQSGYISAVGLNLYCQLLAEAVEEQKAKQAIAEKVTKPLRLPTPTIDLPLTAYIPGEYVSDINTRLSLYQSLVKLDKAEQIKDIAQEFSDRFGTLPLEVKNLLYAVKIKALAAKAGIESISTEDGQIILRLIQGMKFNKQKLEPLIKDGIKVGTTQLRLNPRRLGSEWQKVLEDILKKIEVINSVEGGKKWQNWKEQISQ
ncbi:MAG: transcription-repair coupling factor [Dehalococcoidales bacterium]|nr:transcription-repair coupling factor [Dehalococcoidales bacterium]